MLVQIGETRWIKAKKINEVKLYQKGKAGVWEISVSTDNNTYIHAEYDDKNEALRNLTGLAFTINHKY